VGKAARSHPGWLITNAAELLCCRERQVDGPHTIAISTEGLRTKTDLASASDKMDCARLFSVSRVNPRLHRPFIPILDLHDAFELLAGAICRSRSAFRRLTLLRGKGLQFEDRFVKNHCRCPPATDCTRRAEENPHLPKILDRVAFLFGTRHT
jgi:hypothetical protein